MRRALNLYHLVNILHMVFYAYLMLRLLNIGNVRALVEDNTRIILIVYFVVFVGLSFLAKKWGNGLENPMKTVSMARLLHFISIAVFVLAVILFFNLGRGYVYLVLLSFPIDMVAFVFAYRGSRLPEKHDDELLDDFSSGQEHDL